ncbi:endonuclease [Klenkia terrae]
MTHRETADAVLERYGTTYAADAGIRLADTPAPLWQLLVLAELLSARIDAGIAVAATTELLDAGLTTPDHMLEASWQDRVDALGRGHYRRYDERTSRQLGDLATQVRDRSDGDLRRLDTEIDGVADRVAVELQKFPGFGPTGAQVFLREAQAVWPWLRPHLDDRALRGAERVGLPTDRPALADLVGGDDLARFTAGLVRVSLLPAAEDPLGDS